MDYNIFLLSVQDKVDKEDLSTLKIKFNNLQNKEKVLSDLILLPLQDPIKPLIASIICGTFLLWWLAIDRFMIKDYALGALRAILSILSCALFLIWLDISIDYDDDIIIVSLLVIAVAFLLFSIVWWVVDLFLVYKKIKKQNYIKIIKFI